jgi:ATP-dependent Lon protease
VTADDDKSELDLSRVPLFPLPGVVLFPRAVLPLHIFEDRYRAMTADVLAGADKLIAMALLKPGWEKHYYGRPEIEPVVCVGRILSHEMLADGKYNFLLQGQFRARMLSESGGRAGDKTPYRVAQLAAMEEVPALDIDLLAERQILGEIFDEHSPLGQTGAGQQFCQIIKTPLPTPAIADLAAFTFLEDAAVKQSLLVEADVRQRVRRAVAAVSRFAATFTPPPKSPSNSFTVGRPPDPTVN